MHENAQEPGAQRYIDINRLDMCFSGAHYSFVLWKLWWWGEKKENIKSINIFQRINWWEMRNKQETALMQPLTFPALKKAILAFHLCFGVGSWDKLWSCVRPLGEIPCHLDLVDYLFGNPVGHFMIFANNLLESGIW